MAEDNNFDTFDEEDHDGNVVLSGKKKMFSKELRCLMYGFGDDQNPYTESVELLEDLVIEFITDMTHKAMEIGRTGRVQVEDIVFLVRKDQRKYARVKDLLTMNEELKKARKAFDEVKYAVSQEMCLMSSLINLVEKDLASEPGNRVRVPIWATTKARPQVEGCVAPDFV